MRPVSSGLNALIDVVAEPRRLELRVLSADPGPARGLRLTISVNGFMIGLQTEAAELAGTFRLFRL